MPWHWLSTLSESSNRPHILIRANTGPCLNLMVKLKPGLLCSSRCPGHFMGPGHQHIQRWTNITYEVVNTLASKVAWPVTDSSINKYNHIYMASDALPLYSARPPVYTENDQIATVTVDVLVPSGAKPSASTVLFSIVRSALVAADALALSSAKPSAYRER